MKKECDGETVSEESANNGEILDHELHKARIIYLTGEINAAKADYINSRLQFFASSQNPVFMYINSEGGELTSGYSMIDQIELSPFPVYTIVRGVAASMAATISIFGTRKCRFITKNSIMFLHDMSVELSPNTIIAQNTCVEHLIKYSDEKIKDLASKIKIREKKLRALLSKTCWLTAKEAISMGLVDGIWTKKLENQTNDSCEK